MAELPTFTQRDQALTLLKRRDITRLAELRTAGVTATTVSRMERAGEVVRLARVLYQLPDADLDPHQSLAEAARLVPKGVICLASVEATPEALSGAPRQSIAGPALIRTP